MVLIVAREAADEIMASVRANGEDVYVIGELKARAADAPRVVLEHLEAAFKA